MKTNLSIIIPHYNSTDSLQKLLRSIGEHQDVQIIVVDDKSNTKLNEFERIKNAFSYGSVFLVNDSDLKGAGTCRNIGLRYATGKWLLFADADDFFLDGWYETICEYFNSTYDIVYFVPTSQKTNGSYSKRHVQYANYVKSNQNDKDLRLRYCFTPPWSKLIKREMVEQNKVLFEEVRYSNDVLFSIKTGYFAKLITTDNHCIYCVTEDETNTSLTRIKSSDSFYIRSIVECEKWEYLKKRLDRKSLRIIFRGVFIKRLGVIFKQHYGFQTLVNYFLLCIKYKYPIV